MDGFLGRETGSEKSQYLDVSCMAPVSVQYINTELYQSYIYLHESIDDETQVSWVHRLRSSGSPENHQFLGPTQIAADTLLPRFRKLDEGKTHRKLGKSNPNFLMGQGLAFLQIFPRKNRHFFDPGISSLPHHAAPYCCVACGWCGNASRGRFPRPRISRARRSSAML